MLKELQYPFDNDFILKKKRKIKKKLVSEGDEPRLRKKVAILGDSTTSVIKDILELFLLNYGIEPEFYESEYAQYWQDVMFDNEMLAAFHPDIIYVHTTSRNIRCFPTVKSSEEEIDGLVRLEFEHFREMWDKIGLLFHCPVIQNNFEQPFYRLLGNKDVSDIHGK